MRSFQAHALACLAPEENRRTIPSIRARGAGRVQNTLHEDEIEPAAELASDLGHACDFRKAHARVQTDRSLIAAVDASDQHMLAERSRSRDQFANDEAAEAMSAVIAVDVDAVLDAVAIAGPGAEI